MDLARARAYAEMLHASEREPDGTPLLDHIRRVVQLAPPEARPVAWLHEALESRGVTEQALLMEDLTADQLRALRLLHRTSDGRSDVVYLAHVEFIARAAGPSGHLARMVKIADLEDRCLYPRVRRDGWSPPYADGLELLLDISEELAHGRPGGGARPGSPRVNHSASRAKIATAPIARLSPCSWASP
jgi:hypothetical protein